MDGHGRGPGDALEEIPLTLPRLFGTPASRKDVGGRRKDEEDKTSAADSPLILHPSKATTIMTTQEISLAPSVFVPVAIGFFGLAVGYFVWGGQALFDFPKDTPEVNRTMGLWGFWMPGFMQFITGVYLTVGLTWFGVFDKDPPLYMAAVAFTTYGIY
jgi:hypothetical protein